MKLPHSLLRSVLKLVVIRCLVLSLTSMFWWGCGSLPGARSEEVSFARDIRPLLADRCYACHGPDEDSRKAGLRLDDRDIAVSELDSGAVAIVPGNANESALIDRISESDPDFRMPPEDSGKKSLTPEQIGLIRSWIDEGAVYQPHWAYIPLKRPAIPSVKNENYSDQAIDRFVLAELERRNIEPSPEADPVTLIRRLTFDLTGLPPTQDEICEFVQDSSEQSYERLVDRLLGSPHYGERLATMWLDLVRCADSVGFHGDQSIAYWPYRDYVISSLNANLPFDQFTREQLAGDLLPDATEQQITAATYNRLGMMTAEFGVQEKEYLAIYATDRVRNLSGTWLGVTMGCAECHDHKYDPFTTRDFYSMAAFFADIKENGYYPADQNGIWGESRWLPTPEQQLELKKLSEKIAASEVELESASAELAAAQTAWETELREQQNSGVTSQLPEEVLAIFRRSPESRTEEQATALKDYFRSTSPLLEPVRKEVDELQTKKTTLENLILKMPVTVAVTPRVIRVLPRGNWMDESGPIVQPAVPGFLNKLDTGGRRATRLDLANWLTSSDNPLTSRALVNRIWKIFFGEGICRSMDDLGAQGQWPTHPELMDYLSVELIDNGWDIKRLIHSIVLSRTYRQSSLSRPELAQIDPGNRLLARQSSFRLDAEFVRDNALAVSGLLVPSIGGPSVKPYQPIGYYAQLNFPLRTYQPDSGEKQYRRGLYTHWQRTFLHPMLKVFDAPSREDCTARRPRSNTPSQALTLLNDPTFTEAARALAERILREGGEDTNSRIEWSYRQVVSFSPGMPIVQILTEIYQKHLEYYRSHFDAARQFSEVGNRPPPQESELAELAAWTSVARVLLNLHETITRY